MIETDIDKLIEYLINPPVAIYSRGRMNSIADVARLIDEEIKMFPTENKHIHAKALWRLAISAGITNAMVAEWGPVASLKKLKGEE